MFKKKNLNIPRPIHHDVENKQFPDISEMDLNLPNYDSVVKEVPNQKQILRREDDLPYQKPASNNEDHRDPFFGKTLAKPSGRNIVRDNTLFVKIDKYQESMRTLNLIKEGLMNTEHILNKLHQVKTQEDNEIQKWHDQIKRIKQKIVYMDKNLFEQ